MAAPHADAMLPRFALPTLAAAALFAVPAAAQPAPPAAPEAVPETRQCLSVAAIRGSNVVNSRTIDFTLRDGSVWRSRLPQPCPQLGTERAFSYQTGIPQLCAQDIITVIVPVSGTLSGARCGLAPFEKQPPRPRRRKAD
jgi:hypothetical protein